jgi:intracellular sulfur oxidation DsrE/DsrF family protein
MSRRLLSGLFAFLFIAGGMVAGSKPMLADDSVTAKINPAPKKPKRYLFSVTLHTQEEIDAMLSRAETLSKNLRQQSKKDHAGIALVLHGPEIEMFTRKNYGKFRQLVDKAARLDSEAIIEIKVCRTAMGDLDIKKEDLPEFVEIVPYGPDEEDRLLRQGYTYL